MEGVGTRTERRGVILELLDHKTFDSVSIKHYLLFLGGTFKEKREECFGWSHSLKCKHTWRAVLTITSETLAFLHVPKMPGFKEQGQRQHLMEHRLGNRENNS
uniref:Uncharacterized protein n=1 Tax=Sphaerodactylus townsendi TaxID=933632 RepID=A0ACB8EHJ4_9SAUR